MKSNQADKPLPRVVRSLRCGCWLFVSSRGGGEDTFSLVGHRPPVPVEIHFPPTKTAACVGKSDFCIPAGNTAAAIKRINCSCWDPRFQAKTLTLLSQGALLMASAGVHSTQVRTSVREGAKRRKASTGRER